MALGLCCHWLAGEEGKEKNTLVSKTLRLGVFNKGGYSNEKITQLYKDNLDCLYKHLDIIHKAGISVFRMSSSMFPLFDKVDTMLWCNSAINERLLKIGNFVKQNNIRLTTHPGQFVSLSSDSDRVVEDSKRELFFHTQIFDRMGLARSPYYAINIHGGKGDRRDRLIKSITKLPPSVSDRLTLENCEFAYSVKDLIGVFIRTGVPICYDHHHHTFNTGGLSHEKALRIARKTWPDGIKPLTHLSNTKECYAGKDVPVTKLRQHSDYIYDYPEYMRKLCEDDLIDIDIEAKKKNLAIAKLIKGV